MTTPRAPWPDYARPAASLVSSLSRISSSDACDAGAEAVLPGLIPFGPGSHVAGPILTVAAATDDNLAIHAAVQWAQPGDVIAVAAVGGHCALVGELVSLRAKEIGVSGFAVHGLVRDVDSLAVPVFARGTSPLRPASERMGAVAVPIVFAGVRLHPGDILICDGDGTALVPLKRAQDILTAAKQIAKENALRRRDIVAGREELGWLHAALRRTGLETYDD